MVSFTAIIKKFGEKGEKTGWTYVEVPAAICEQLKPGNKKSFRVKGSFDEYAFEGLAMLPMGAGVFIIPLNATIRKQIRKQKGALLNIKLEEDIEPYQLNGDLLECIADEPRAKLVFDKLPRSHQNYYSKWIESAKTEATAAKRIAIVVRGLSDGLEFGDMLRREREEKRLLGR